MKEYKDLVHPSPHDATNIAAKFKIPKSTFYRWIESSRTNPSFDPGTPGYGRSSFRFTTEQEEDISLESHTEIPIVPTPSLLSPQYCILMKFGSG